MTVRIIGCLILLLMLTATALASATVTVNADSSVNGPALTLGEIAGVIGDDPGRVRALQAVKLGAAPKPGTRIVWTKQMLGDRLSASGADFTGITWNVPDMITITANVKWVAGAQIAAAAHEAIARRLNMPEDKREIELTGVVGDVAAPPGEIQLTADLPYGIRGSGPTSVAVNIVTDGRVYQKIIVRYNVRIFEDVIVAASPLAPREPLTAGKLTYIRTDVSKFNGNYYTDMEKVIGLAAKRAIAPGTVIADSLLEKPIIVKRGSQVTILARSGELEVTATGIALQDGTEGQSIRVQNISSKRNFSATVVAEGMVQVVTIQ